MDYNNMFEELLKSYGYTYNAENDSRKQEKQKDTSTSPPGVADDECRCGNSDIPGGFQDLNPLLFIIIGEIIGDVAASRLPFNIQNSIGNWLQLVGQAILTFNAQQQYFTGGPGRYYNPIYRNSANPFCTGTVDESQSNTAGTGGSKTSTTGKVNTENDYASVNKKLEDRVGKLERELLELKKEIYK